MLGYWQTSPPIHVLLKRVFVTKKENNRNPVDDHDAKGAMSMFGVQPKKGVPEIVKKAMGKS